MVHLLVILPIRKQAILNWKDNAENLYESIKYTRHKELAVTVKEGEAIGDWVLNWALLTIKYKVGRGPVQFMGKCCLQDRKRKNCTKQDFL